MDGWTLGLSMWSLHGLHIPAESSPVCISESKEIIQEFCKNSQQLHMNTEILEMYKVSLLKYSADVVHIIC